MHAITSQQCAAARQGAWSLILGRRRSSSCPGDRVIQLLSLLGSEVDVIVALGTGGAQRDSGGRRGGGTGVGAGVGTGELTVHCCCGGGWGGNRGGGWRMIEDISM